MIGKPFLGLGIFAVIYFAMKSKSTSVADNILANVGYVPPEADPVKTPAVKVKPTSNPTVKTPISSTTGTPTPSVLIIQKRRCIANQKSNVRNFFKPEQVLRQTYVGESLGTYLTQKELTIGGVKGVFVYIQGPSILPGDNSYIYVLKSAVDIVY